MLSLFALIRDKRPEDLILFVTEVIFFLSSCLCLMLCDFIISHDGTITNYRILLGEKGLAREDFLGEAGLYKMKI